MSLTRDGESPSRAPARERAVYDSAETGRRAVKEALELWRFRHFVVELVSRDIKVRYKRSALGVAWTLLNPLLQMVAMTFVFSIVVRQKEIANFPAYFLTGTLFWTFFSQSTSHAANMTNEAGDIGKRAFVPRSAFVAAAIGVGLVNVVLSLIPLALVFLVTGQPFHAEWAFLPVPLALAVAFAFGVGLVVFTLATRFVDVRETYLAVLQPWFFVTPILYSQTMVPENLRWLIRVNPMTYLVELFRSPLYNGWLPGWKTAWFSVAAALTSLVAGWLFYSSRIERYGSQG